MNSTLLEYKRKAVLMTKSSTNAPEAVDGNRSKGYIEIMKELWDQHGYEYLEIPRKNLHNQGARLEKSLGNAANNILDKVGQRQGNETERNNEENIVNIDTISTEENANQLEHGTNLRNIDSIIPMGPTQNQLTAEARALKEKASQMFEFVYSQPEDFGAREIDTRTK